MKLRPIDPARARTQKLETLSRIVERKQLASPVKAGESMRRFLMMLISCAGAERPLPLSQWLRRLVMGGWRSVCLICRTALE